MEKLLAKKGNYKVTATILAEEASVFINIEGPRGMSSSIEAFEAEQGFEDMSGVHCRAPQTICDWVERNIEDWYEYTDNLLEAGE